MAKRLLVIDVAALGHGLLARHGKLGMHGLEFRPAASVFPAVTCTVQASFRTASAPGEHGMVANGLMLRDLGRVMFWEQSARLVAGRRIWDGLRRRGGRVALLFWQQSLGEDADVLLSPAPIHKHHGGMIQDCYSRPDGLYGRLSRAVRRRFSLMRYWGPLASARIGSWIARATAAVLQEADLAPDLCLTYLPTLDYDLQRYGPDAPRATRSLYLLERQFARLLRAAEAGGYEVLVFGDYAMAACDRGTAFPNRKLREAGLLKAREVHGMLYADLHTSRAFAMADHEIAHVFVRDAADVAPVRELLAALPGVQSALDREAQEALGLAHPRSGELVLVAREGHWFAYPWWTHRWQAPDYARHVDIHNKPGFDPCELFFGWPPLSTSLNTARVGGSHGRVGEGREIAWAATFEMPGEPSSLLDLAAATRDWLDKDT